MATDPFAIVGQTAPPLPMPASPDPFSLVGQNAPTPPSAPSDPFAALKPQSQSQPQAQPQTQSESDPFASIGRPVAPLMPVPVTPPDSTWQKIKNFVQHPLVSGGVAEELIPGLASIRMGAEGLKKVSEQTGHPTVARVFGGVSGAEQGLAGLASDATSPLSLGIIAATGGFGAIEGAAAKTAASLGLSKEAVAVALKFGPKVARLVNLGFATSGLVSAYNNIPEIKKAFDAGNTEEVARLLVKNAGVVGVSAYAGLHALGKVKPVGVEGAEGESIHEAPAVKIVESEAAKLHEEAAPTEKTAVAPAEKPLKIFHGTSGDIVDVAKLSPEEFAKPGSLGVGSYFSTEAGVAGNYAGPENVPTGGRVIAGEVQPGVKLLSADQPLPEKLQSALTEKFGDKGKTYSDFIADALKEGGDVNDIQKTVAEQGYHGVKGLAHGAESVMLFGESLTGKPMADVIKSVLPTATVVPENHTPVVSRDEILSEASQRITNNSPVLQGILDPAKLQTPEDITAALRSAADHIEKNLDPRVGTRISFSAQKQLAADLGMKVEDLLNRRSGEAFSAEQAIAGRSILKSSADNVLDLAKKASTGDVDAKAQFALAVAKHQEIVSQVAGFTSEAGRALGSFRIADLSLPTANIAEALTKFKPETLDAATKIVGGLDPTAPDYALKARQVLQIAKTMEQLDPEATATATKLLAKIDPNDPGYIRKTNELIREIKPSTTSDKIFEVYRNMLLSGPATVIKKVASESVMMALEFTKKTLVGGLESLKSVVGMQKSPDAFASEGFWYARGAAQALTHAKAVLSGEFDIADAPGFEHGGTSAIKGTAGKIMRFPSELIGRQTNLVYLTNYMGEINALAARQALTEGLAGEALASRQEYLAHNPTPEMSKAANDMGLHNTFQSELGKTGKAVSAAIQSNPVSKFLFPFFRTPVNLVKASAEYSPYGALKGTWQGDLGLQTRGMLGSSIAAGIAYLASQGVITGGGPVDFKQRKVKEETGWQPYSVKIGGKYFSYHKAEPLGLTLGAVADAVHSISKDEDPAVQSSKVVNATNHIIRNVSDLPFLMQIANIVDSLTHLGNGNTGERMIDNLLSSAVVPAGVKDIAQAADPTLRQPQYEGSDNPLTGLKQTIQSRVPGLTGNVPPQIGITGEPLQAPASRLGGANPFPVSTEKANPVISELARLGITVENLPNKPIKVKGVHGKMVELPNSTPTQQEATKLQTLETQDAYRRYSLVVQHPQWQQVPDEEKVVILKKIHEAILKGRYQRLLQIRRQTQPTLPNEATHYYSNGQILPVQ